MTNSAQNYNLFLKDINKDDISLVGGKGANLGEMINAGFPVPNGFAVTTLSYDEFLKENDLFSKINDDIKNVNVDVSDELDSVSKKIQKTILQGEIPHEVAVDIVKFYKKLSGPFSQALVAVRSSATAEDLPGMSFAGQQATFLNVKGQNNLITAVRECWASLFTPRAIFYRHQNKIPTGKVKISVIVQKMVDSNKSANVFTVNPANYDKNEILIEAGFGIGESLSKGYVNPDIYVVDKNSLDYKKMIINKKNFKVIRDVNTNDTIRKKIFENEQNKRVLENYDVNEIAKISVDIENKLGFPVYVEFGFDKKIFVLQANPITGLYKNVQKSDWMNGEILSKGIGISPGFNVGRVKKSRNFSNGDIAVCDFVNEDIILNIDKLKGIVVNESGYSNYVAVLAREFNVPMVSANDSTALLEEGLVVTVDGVNGRVFKGELKEKIEIVDEVITDSGNDLRLLF